MDSVSRIEIFITVVKHASFSKAAKSLGMTSSAISKQVQNLEEELQVKLLNRTTRMVSPTEEGMVYFERARRALADLAEAQETIQDMKQHPTGPLKISVPASFGIPFLTPALTEFAKQYPDVSLDLHYNDAMIDIAREEMDLTVRITGQLPDSSLTVKKLGDCPTVICASPSYWQEHGKPKTPADLANHDFVTYSRVQQDHVWQYIDPTGKKGKVIGNGRFQSDSGHANTMAACDGLGVTVAPIFLVQNDIIAGRLEPCLSDYQSVETLGIYALYPANRYVSTRLRLLIDHLAEHCRDLPWHKCQEHLKN